MRAVITIFVVAALSSATACQALLDLHAPDARGDASAPVDATTAESGAADSASDASPPIECGKGRFYCATFNACVDRGDPAFGCGAADCKPCGGAHATATRCVPGKGDALVCSPTCAAGFADCDGDPANGCEKPLGTFSDCTGCGAACKSGTFCVTSPLTECSTACVATTCGSECVDIKTSATNCGTCFHACPGGVNATGRCVGGACTTECVAGAHACANGCALDNDPFQCGSGCVDCTRDLTNATSATCQAGACVFQCYEGFWDCDRLLMNGCEHFGPCEGQ